MRWTPLWAGTALLAALAVFFIRPSALAQQVGEKDRSKLPPILDSAPIQNLPNDDELQRLEKALFNERHAIMKSSYMLFLGGHHWQCRPVLDSARQVRSAGMWVFAKPTEQIRLLEQLLEFSEYVATQLAFNEGTFLNKGRQEWPLQQQTLREFRLEMQIELAKLKKANK